MKVFGKEKNSNPEILIYIKQEPIDTVLKRRVIPSSDGLKAEVIIEPETPTRAGWKLDVTDCIRPSKNGLYVEAIRGATKAIKFNLQNPDLTKISKLTSDEQQAFINMKIFKAHYGQLLKDLLSALKPMLIILAVTIIISIVIGGYNAYQISKIPEAISSAATIIKPTPTPSTGVIG
jgi:hypothetical protein